MRAISSWVYFSLQNSVTHEEAKNCAQKESKKLSKSFNMIIQEKRNASTFNGIGETPHKFSLENTRNLKSFVLLQVFFN